MIVDTALGAEDDWALVRALAERSAQRRPFVVLLMTRPDEHQARAALEAGTDQVLPRPAFTARLPELLAGRAGRGYTSTPAADRGGPRREESP